MEVRVTPLRDWLTGGVRQMVLILQATVALLLLIACLNIASLQTARASTRQREISVRAAIGAGRGRLIRQLLTESVLLSVFGGALGLALGYLSIGWLRGFLPANLHLADGVRVNASVLIFAVCVVGLTTILSGLIPALASTRTALHDAMQEGRYPGQAKQQLQTTLVIAEVAMTMVLLAGSSLFIRTFLRLANADPGFRPGGVLTMRISLPPSTYADARSWRAFFARLAERAGAIPGVDSAAVGGGLPVIGNRSAGGISIEGEPDAPPGGRPSIPFTGVTPNYFHALGIPILRGRNFTPADEDGSGVAIINQAFAEKFFPGQDALGKRIEIGGREGRWREIVGIAGNVKQQGRRVVDPFIVYSPLSQFAEPEALLILKSASIAPEQLTSAAIAVVHELDRNLPVYDIATMQERLGSAISTPRTNMTLMTAFASLALVLATVGVFGVIAYFVARRARDIGIRMALGANKRGIVSMVLHRGMMVAGIGVLIGLAGALAIARSLRSVLDDVQTSDPLSLCIAAVLFALITTAACLIPALRAANADPMATLRHD
jgi:putative ABC transport system permease protein